jgi:3-oxoacyl-[acyl-carrier protein] reductase
MQERDVPGPRGAQVTIEGSTVIVTGASTGIGRATAVALRDRGARVVVSSRSAERLQPVAEEVGGLPVVCDVGDYDQVQGLVDRAVAWGGKLDIMVNNAGYGAFGLLHEIDPDRVADMFRTNVLGVINGVRAAGEVLVRQGHGGAIVNVSSIVGVHGNWGQTNYAASKAGIIGFTKSLARELGSRNVRANVVAPGYVTTQLTDVLPEEATQAMLTNTPLGRLGDPEDVAGAVRFLCSDAAKFVTGDVLLVDGGLGM